MQDAKVTKIEQAFLEKLIDLLKENKLTPEDAKVITTKFLANIDNYQVDFGPRLLAFTTKYARFKSIYATYLEFDEQSKTDVDFLKKNKYHLRMDDLVKLRISVKKEYLSMVINFLEAGILTPESAKAPTKAFISAVDTENVNSLKENVKKFCDQNPQFSGLNSFLLSKLDTIQLDQLKAKMESMIGSSQDRDIN